MGVVEAKWIGVGWGGWVRRMGMWVEEWRGVSGGMAVFYILRWDWHVDSLIYYGQQMNFKKGSSPFSENSSAKGSNSPTLADSKSSINLYHSFEDAHRHCQNQQHPPKNTSRQFLRYTVNLNKSDLKQLTGNISGHQKWSYRGKLLNQQAPGSTPDLQEESAGTNLPISTRSKYQKRVSDPQKKQGLEGRQIPVPKFLEKKTQALEGLDTRMSKTEKAGSSKTAIGSFEKKTFTPKCSKTAESKAERNPNDKPYSPADLLQWKLCHSPSCDSSTSAQAAGHPPRHGQGSSGGHHGVELGGWGVGDFRRVRFLGEGRFGQVHLVLHVGSNSIYAMKQIKKETVRKSKMENQLLMEIKMQFYLNHPNILKLYGVCSDDDNVYLLLEYMEEGTLYSQLKKMKAMPEEQASRKLRDVLEGVNFLHDQQIAHRDIKPENIVISNDVCKICDLGWAAVCDGRRKTICGTIDYASPEVLEGKEYGISIDLWCLGILCYELIVGKCPFYHISRKETMKKIINAELTDVQLPDSLSREARGFIERLLVKDPEERMSANEALLHPMISQYIDEDLEGLRGLQNKKC